MVNNSRQATEILNAMFDWSNGKTSNIEEKSEMLDELVKDLTNQVKVLDEKLDNLS